VNLEVVRREYPCRFFRSNPASTRCRSRILATHVRPEGTDRTYCGHTCLPEMGWTPLPGTHPEDIEQLDRCTVCYQRLPETEVIL
jgi:hypothetical protein